MIFNMTLSEQGSLAELTNIRVGADGTNYPSAGDAVRGQVTDLKEDFTDFKNETTEKGDNVFTTKNKETGKYVAYNTGVVGTYAPFTLSDYIEVEQGTLFFKSAIIHFAFYDVNKDWITNTWSSAVSQITVPSTAKYIRVSMESENFDAFIISYNPVTGEEQTFYFDGERIKLNDDSVQPKQTTFFENGGNYFTTENKIVGKYVFYGDGDLRSNADYTASDFIEVEQGSLYFSRPILHFAFYDIDKTWITNTWTSAKEQITVPASAKYIRVSMESVYFDTFIMAYSAVTGYEKYEVVKAENLPSEVFPRKKIIIGANNYSLIDGFVEAYKRGNCDVYILDGTYDISNDISTIRQMSGYNRGLLVGRNNHYYFSANSKVICNYTGSDTSVKENFSVFMSADSGDYLIEGLNLECSYIRYAIHDEMGGIADVTYKHEYKNCRIVASYLTYSAIIGGGLGFNATIVIDGCYFNSIDGVSSEYQADAFYHGNYDTSLDDSNTSIYVFNTYFANGFHLVAPNHETNKKYCMYANNSASEDITYDSTKWDVVKFNNEVRA